MAKSPRTKPCDYLRRIQKRVTTRLWDTLSQRDQLIIAQDVDKEAPITKWFESTVASETKAKFESDKYWMNEYVTFLHSQYNPPMNYRGWRGIPE